MHLFPEINPYKEQFLKVDDTHEIYIEQVGNPKGTPVIFLHGGPGAGLSEIYRRYFNPEIYRIILFDQRGSGKSKPYCSVENNTSQSLIQDIKKISKELEIEKFILYGGSWGSTLALLYAEEYPESIYSLVLRGIFLCRKKDIDWFYQNGASSIFPEYWNEFIKDIPEEEESGIFSRGSGHTFGESDTNRLARGKTSETHGALETRRSLKTASIPISVKPFLSTVEDGAAAETRGDWDEPNPKGIESDASPYKSATYPYNHFLQLLEHLPREIQYMPSLYLD